MADVELADALSDLGTPIEIVSVTTGAAPVDIPLSGPNVARKVIMITTGGTGGVEVINLPAYSPLIDGEGYPQTVGQQVVLCIAVLTDPGDTVQIKVDGAADGSFLSPAYQSMRLSQGYSSVVLDFLGSAAVFQWAFWTWMLDVGASDGFMTYVQKVGNLSISSAGDITLTSGRSANVQASTSDAAGGSGGDGGDVVFTYGNGDGAGRKGGFKPNLPTPDPGVSGVAYVDASGFVKISP